MNIKSKFIQLTSRTYPHGTEHEMANLLSDRLQRDEYGNFFIKIGDSDVMFTSHLDTATSALCSIKHVFEGDLIKTDGKSILGADDKAGVTIMLYMIEKNVPGLYYFFLGEEVGCVGSGKVSANKDKLDQNIKKVVSFDRRGTSSVITYQSGRRCTSDEFANALAAELNKHEKSFQYKIDEHGLLTDSIKFTSIYPECTNLSVGYTSEHTFSESQNINHLEKLAIACTKVDWASLPVKRDPSKPEYRNYYGWGWNDDYEYDYSTRETYRHSYNNNSYRESNYATPTNKIETIWFVDKDYDYVSKVDIDQKGKYSKVDLSKDRIIFEKYLIADLFDLIELDHTSLEWDGLHLKIHYNNSGWIGETDRNELIEFLPELKHENLVDSRY